LESYNIYKGTEFEGLSGAHIQQQTHLIKQKFDQKRARYHQLRNFYPMHDKWDELNEKIIEFDNSIFNPWNQKWSQLQRSADISQLDIFFKEGNKLFDEMEAYISSIPVHSGSSNEVESLKKEIMSRIESDIINLKTAISVQIEEGIKQLVGLNAELGLEKNFKANIEKDLEKANYHRYGFLGAFILTVVCIPIFLASTFFSESISELAYIEIVTLRVGVTISLAILSYFFFSQYKIYQLISLRYSHLFGFLGGGATFINQLIGGDAKSKEDVNKKMAELFLELEMLNNQVKSSSHPVEMTMDKAIEAVEKLSKVSGKFGGKSN